MEVAIVGGGAAGMTAASRIKALKPEWNVRVFEASSYVSHAPCGIPYAIEFDFPTERLMYYKPEFFVKKRGIDVHLNSKVVKVKRGSLVVNENGEEKEYEWDKILIATGASPRVPPIDGVDLENVFTVDLPPIVDRIKRAVAEAENVVIVGAGYIGVEMAEAFSSIGKKVTLIGKYDYPLPKFDREIGEIVRREVEKRVDYKVEKVVAIEGKDKVERVITDKNEHRADVVILATGVKPNVELAEQIGAELGKSGAIKTNEFMETTVENVYAAGDCAECINLITGKPSWIPLAPTANKMGYVAGVNMSGQRLEFPGVVGSQITKFYDLEIGRTGLTEREAKAEGFNVKSAFIEAHTKVPYHPNPKRVYIKAVKDVDTSRILGAQIVGYEDVAMRVNVFALAIQAGFTTKDVFFSDLVYAPPFTPIWDPVIVTARVLRF